MSSSQQSRSMTSTDGVSRRRVVAVALALAMASPASEAFSPSGRLPAHFGVGSSSATSVGKRQRLDLALDMAPVDTELPLLERAGRFVGAAVATAALSAAILFTPGAALAENELSAKYGGSFDSSLVDQNCLVDRCSVQAKACLADDPSCRKGLTCTAKCLGDNACITGCMARYGDENLDNLLKCTIEDNDCIKIAILEGGADEFGQEPRPPAPTVRNFNLASLEGAWYKTVGFNPNYDCYACQRNTFSAPSGNSLQVDVEFSMPHLLPDGSPPPPKNVREQVTAQDDGLMLGSQSIGFNAYSTHENMVFDQTSSKHDKATNLVLKNSGANKEANYARTAHSEGEMFGLKFWENWYIIGENDDESPEFKFVYYNGKTRQNTYEGAFVYSRSRDLDETSMKKVYQIASDAGMNPDQFCKIRNGCFADENKDSSSSSSLEAPVEQTVAPSDDAAGFPGNPFRGLMASTRVSQLLGVEPVAAEFVPGQTAPITAPRQAESKRAWWFEVGDYLENPHRHFQAMDSLRQTVEWPEDVKVNAGSSQ